MSHNATIASLAGSARQNKAKRAMLRPAKKDPMSPWKTIRENQPFTDGEITHLLIPVHMAFEAFRTGKATQDDMDTLAIAANVCLIRAEQISQELVDAVRVAR